jgi:hypothetical protein
MIPPLCPDCGTRHHSYQGHVFASNAVANAIKPVANNVANAVANKKHGKYKDPEARKKYMRELMRSRRAKAQ